jgi:hypothetical protein
MSLFAGGRYGFSDYEWKGRARVSYGRASGAGLSVEAYDDHDLAGDAMERSLFVNSLAAQEFGSDYTDPFGSRGFALSASSPSLGAWRATVSFASEKHRPLAVRANPVRGDFDLALPAARMKERRLELLLERPTKLTFGGFEAKYRVAGSGFRYALSSYPDTWETGVRIGLHANVERPFGTSRLVTQFLFAAVGDKKGSYSHATGVTSPPAPSLQPQQLVYLGGTVTGPGYDFHEFVGTSGLSARFEWQMPAPFPAVSLGRFGRAPARMTLAPHFSVVAINGGAGAFRRGHGLYPSAGLGALTVFDILRIDVARGLRNGRWTMSIDLNRDFWPVL